MFGSLIVVAYLTATAVKQVPAVIGSTVGKYDRALTRHASHPLEDGTETLGRDPFSKPGEASFHGGANSDAVRGPDDLRLTGVVFSGRRRIAYIDGKRLREGDRVEGFVVTNIEFNRVSVSGGGRTYDLWLNASSSRDSVPTLSNPKPDPPTAGRNVAAFPEVLAEPRGSAAGASEGG